MPAPALDAPGANTPAGRQAGRRGCAKSVHTAGAMRHPRTDNGPGLPPRLSACGPCTCWFSCDVTAHKAAQRLKISSNQAEEGEDLNGPEPS